MLKIKKRFKPRFKKFVNSKVIIPNKQKILSLKKKKWERYVNYFSRFSVNRKRNCYYKFYDQRSHNISRFVNRFVNKFKLDLLVKRRFKLLYGNLGGKYVKLLAEQSALKSKFDSKKRNTRHYFMCLLESRLDIILLKSYFALNIRSARQLISHGNVKVNGKVIKTSSLSLKCGDKITVKQKAYPLLEYRLANNNLWPLPPKYLQINYKIFQIILVSAPLNSNLSNNFHLKLDFGTVLNLYGA